MNECQKHTCNSQQISLHVYISLCNTIMSFNITTTVVFPSSSIYWATAMFKAHSRCCRYSNEQKKSSDPFTFQPAGHRWNNKPENCLFIPTAVVAMKEGDALRAHKVEPHLSRVRNISLKTCYFSCYLNDEQEPSWMWVSGVVRHWKEWILYRRNCICKDSERGRNTHLLRDQKPEIMRQNYAPQVRLLRSKHKGSHESEKRWPLY